MKQAIVMFAEASCSSSIQIKNEKLQLGNNAITPRMECSSNNLHDQLPSGVD